MIICCVRGYPGCMLPASTRRCENLAARHSACSQIIRSRCVYLIKVILCENSSLGKSAEPKPCNVACCNLFGRCTQLAFRSGKVNGAHTVENLRVMFYPDVFKACFRSECAADKIRSVAVNIISNNRYILSRSCPCNING